MTDVLRRNGELQRAFDKRSRLNPIIEQFVGGTPTETIIKNMKEADE